MANLKGKALEAKLLSGSNNLPSYRHYPGKQLPLSSAGVTCTDPVP